MAESGATDFVDIEGGGIGEGEGVTDVSDQIETEDQVGLQFFRFSFRVHFLFYNFFSTWISDGDL